MSSREGMKIRRITIWNEKEEIISDALPHVNDNCIMIPEYPRSLVLMTTSNFVVCNYLPEGGNTFTYHFFISGPRKVSWEELDDDLRMRVRMEIYLQQGKFPYEDERYYTLEALCD